MVYYLVKKSRDGTLYKVFLGLSVILSCVSTVILVIQSKRLGELFKNGKFLEITIPISLIGLLLLMSLISFIYYILNTKVEKFKDKEGGDEDLSNFKKKVNNLLFEDNNGNLKKEIESVKVKLNFRGKIVRSHRFSKEFYIMFLITSETVENNDKLGKTVNLEKNEGKYYQNWLKKSYTEYGGSAARSHLEKFLKNDDQVIEFFNRGKTVGAIEYGMKDTVIVDEEKLVAEQKLFLKDCYYVSQVVIKYKDGSRNIVKYKPSKSFVDSDKNSVVKDFNNCISNFGGYSKNDNIKPEPSLDCARCDILFGSKKLVSEKYPVSG